jgi:hypothetical protein
MMECSHSLPELRSMWPRVVVLDAVEQAKYADDVCVQCAVDEHFCLSQLSRIHRTFPLPPSNTTGVGNLAYLSLHAHQAYRDQFKLAHIAYTTLLKMAHRLDAS